MGKIEEQELDNLRRYQKETNEEVAASAKSFANTIMSGLGEKMTETLKKEEEKKNSWFNRIKNKIKFVFG